MKYDTFLMKPNRVSYRKAINIFPRENMMPKLHGPVYQFLSCRHSAVHSLLFSFQATDGKLLVNVV